MFDQYQAELRQTLGYFIGDINPALGKVSSLLAPACFSSSATLRLSLKSLDWD